MYKGFSNVIFTERLIEVMLVAFQDTILSMLGFESTPGATLIWITLSSTAVRLAISKTGTLKPITARPFWLIDLIVAFSSILFFEDPLFLLALCLMADELNIESLTGGRAARTSLVFDVLFCPDAKTVKRIEYVVDC